LCGLFSAAVLITTLAATGASAADRSRVVAGWVLTDRSEEDGGRLIGMAKSGRNWRLEHSFNLWHGNGGVYVGATFRWRECRSGEVEGAFPWDEPITTETMAGRTRDYMEECGLNRAQQREVLAGLGKALVQVRQWIEDYRRDTRHWME
jgi:hypothetical protein